ncbi:MAG: FliH/SctL family protein [Chthoniobacteraceae bacterium]
MRSSIKQLRLTAPLRRVSLRADEIEAVRHHEEIERARKAAYQQGFEDAKTWLDKQMAEQRSEVIQMQEQTLQSITEGYARFMGQLGSVLPGLAVEISRRVLGGMEPDRERIERIVNETLSEIAPGTSDIEVALCPADFELMNHYHAQLQDKFPGLHFVADAGLQVGDCRMRSGFGIVDARVETKLQNLSRSLK